MTSSSSNDNDGPLHLRPGASPGELLLPLRVHPKASRQRLNGSHDGALKIAVTAPPEKGKANAAIVKFLAKRLGLPKSQVRIVAGEKSQNKTAAITGATPATIQALAEP